MRLSSFPNALATGARALAPAPVLDFWASRLNPVWSLTAAKAKVVDVRPASVDAVTLTLRPNRRWGGFAPGQHVNVGVEVDGRRITRSYSPARARRPGCIEITVKRVNGGRLSQHLCEFARVGDVLELGPAFGEMIIPEGPAGSRLFLAGGSGITPLMALTREFAARGMPQPLTLLYWARRRNEFCFVEELRELARRFPNFRVRFMLTGESAAAADEGEGRIDETRLVAAAGALAAHRIYACGPAGFVEAARAVASGYARSFAAEAFSPPAWTAAAAPGVATVTLTRSGRVLEVARGSSLLMALEQQGLTPASGCRMGICNTCVCAKRSGSTRNLVTGDVESDAVSALKLCVNAASSDLVLDL